MTFFEELIFLIKLQALPAKEYLQKLSYRYQKEEFLKMYSNPGRAWWPMSIVYVAKESGKQGWPPRDPSSEATTRSAAVR